MNNGCKARPVFPKTSVMEVLQGTLLGQLWQQCPVRDEYGSSWIRGHHVSNTSLARCSDFLNGLRKGQAGQLKSIERAQAAERYDTRFETVFSDMFDHWFIAFIIWGRAAFLEAGPQRVMEMDPVGVDLASGIPADLTALRPGYRGMNKLGQTLFARCLSSVKDIPTITHEKEGC